MIVASWSLDWIRILRLHPLHQQRLPGWHLQAQLLRHLQLQLPGSEHHWKLAEVAVGCWAQSQAIAAAGLSSAPRPSPTAVAEPFAFAWRSFALAKWRPGRPFAASRSLGKPADPSFAVANRKHLLPLRGLHSSNANECRSTHSSASCSRCQDVGFRIGTHAPVPSSF